MDFYIHFVKFSLSFLSYTNDGYDDGWCNNNGFSSLWDLIIYLNKNINLFCPSSSFEVPSYRLIYDLFKGIKL